MLEVPDKVRKQINQLLREANAIKEDLEQAKRAGIAGVDVLNVECQDCIDRMVKQKAELWPNKP